MREEAVREYDAWVTVAKGGAHLLNVCLELIDGLEIVRVEEDLDAGKQQLQLPLDGGDCVLVGPAMAEEEVPALGMRKRERGRLAARPHAQRPLCFDMQLVKEEGEGEDDDDDVEC